MTHSDFNLRFECELCLNLTDNSQNSYFPGLADSGLLTISRSE